MKKCDKLLTCWKNDGEKCPFYKEGDFCSCPLKEELDLDWYH